MGVTVRNGTVSGVGGGIHNDGTITLTKSTVSGNSVSTFNIIAWVEASPTKAP